MKKYLLSVLSAAPATAWAHPGHDPVDWLHAVWHMLSGFNGWLLPVGLVAIVLMVVYAQRQD